MRDMKAQIDAEPHSTEPPLYSAPAVSHPLVQDTGGHDTDEVQEAEVVNPETMHHIQSLEDTQREMIVQTLERCNGNRKTAAEQLGISERTLYRRIKEYGL